MFQQKWDAKKETRAYHGDHLAERQFKTVWDRRFVGVASDNPHHLKSIPLASQMYASLERRLDIAVFRALFASSTRQAKQLVVHGKVKVNGRQVRQPGLLLRAGDLFEVDPAAVIMNVSSPTVGTPSAALKEDEEAAAAAASEQKESADETAATTESGDATAVESEGSGEEAAAAASVGGSIQRKKQFWMRIGSEAFVPKPFMSAFAFVPEYLEVSYETCSAVYLRDPVARPGLTDVPSPLPTNVHALAASFYQRGR